MLVGKCVSTCRHVIMGEDELTVPMHERCCAAHKCFDTLHRGDVLRDLCQLK